MIVRDGNGRHRRLVALGRSGGEGAIFRVEDDETLAAKIYHANLSGELTQKLLAMCKSAPVDPGGSGAQHGSIAWPREPLYSASGRIVGFTMPLVDVNQFRQAHLFYDPEDRTQAFGSSFTWRHLMTAAQNLSSTVAAVHMRGHRVGDLRESNLLVAPSGLVVLIDCDSFQIRDDENGCVYHCRVGSGEYLPPELQAGVDFSRLEVDRLEADRFSLAVLVFRFLMNGTHPFQGKGAILMDCPTIERKIRRGFFPYVAGSPVVPPDHAPRYRVIPASLRQLFERCFVQGLQDRRQRPTSMEWYQALHTEGRRLRHCSRNQHHWFAGDLQECPWCEEERRGRKESFPRNRPRQYAVRGAAARNLGGRSAAAFAGAGRSAPGAAVRAARPLPAQRHGAVHRRQRPAPQGWLGAATTTLVIVALLAAVAALGAVAFKSLQGPPSTIGASGAAAAGPAEGPNRAPNQAPAPAAQAVTPASTPLPADAFARRLFPALGTGTSLGGSAAVRPCSECSGGSAVDISSGSLTFDVSVPVEGDYSIGVYYAASAASTIGVSVNGGAAQTLTLGPSFDVENPNRGSYVGGHLLAGSNTVRLSSPVATGPMIDKITVQLANT